MASLLLGSACATGSPDPPAPEPQRFDLLYESGDYEGAARVFEADSTLHSRERPLFRAGLIHAMPRTEVFEPDRATAYLDRLLALHPDTGYREAALALTGLFDVLRESRGRELRLQQRLDRLQEQLDRLQEQLDRLKAIDLEDTLP